MAGSRKGAWVRAVAARAVAGVASDGRSLDAALADAEKDVQPEDVPLLRNLCFGTLRNHWRLQAFADRLLNQPLKQRDSDIAALLRIGLFQLAGTRVPDHAAVSQTVEAARLMRKPKLAGLVNAILRRFLRENLADLDAQTDEERYNHPSWYIEAVRRDWPDDWQGILEANDERAPMWLRVNSRVGSLDEYCASLDEAGAEAGRLEGFDDALRLAEPMAVATLPGFEDGRVSVQDAAAQLAAPWLLSAGANRILDACAAPGGKSAHLLERGGDGLDLTCVDADETRLGSVNGTLARLGLSATVRHGDASKPEEWWDGKPFDGILLDAPCSASGVIRRHPDIKLLRRESDIAALSDTQSGLLEALWPLLAPGGRLLYVTCSALSAENEQVVDGFLEATADARENDMLPNNNIRDVMRRKACGYQILPGAAGLDGFYFACLEKAS